MFLFLLGILADEAFRRLIVPFFRRHPEHVARLARLRPRSPVYMRGFGDSIDGAAIDCTGLGGIDLAGLGLLGAMQQTEDLDARGMHYMDREGPSEIDGGAPPSDYGGSALPFFDVSGVSPLDFGAGLASKIRDKAIARAQDQAAEAIVSNFADEALSGCLGAVDEQARAAMARHLEWHRRRAELAGCMGWGIPGLSTLAKVKGFADRLSPSAYLKRKLMARARGGGGGGRAPGPQPDGAPEEPAPMPEGEGEAETMEGNDMRSLQSPTNQLVHTLAGLPPALRPIALAHLRRRRARGGGGWRGAPPAVTGWGLPSFFRGAGKVANNPAGRLLISAVPGGATAVAARDIANKALKSGDLKPQHLKAAGDLSRRGRGGDQAALMKIAQIKHKAGRGDRNAEVALDRIKLAHCIQTGGRCAPSGGGTVRQHYHAGVESMNRGYRRPHRF